MAPLQTIIFSIAVIGVNVIYRDLFKENGGDYPIDQCILAFFVAFCTLKE
jgi:hypothetical protein